MTLHVTILSKLSFKRIWTKLNFQVQNSMCSRHFSPFCLSAVYIYIRTVSFCIARKESKDPNLKSCEGPFFKTEIALSLALVDSNCIWKLYHSPISLLSWCLCAVLRYFTQARLGLNANYVALMHSSKDLWLQMDRIAMKCSFCQLAFYRISLAFQK